MMVLRTLLSIRKQLQYFCRVSLWCASKTETRSPTRVTIYMDEMDETSTKDYKLFVRSTLGSETFVARMNYLFLWYVQFHLPVINTYKTVNLAWQCDFEILVERRFVVRKE